VLVVDDWITTGSSARAVRDLTVAAGATYVGTSVLVNKADPATIDDLAVRWLVTFAEIGARERSAVVDEPAGRTPAR
jgi:adenine phosphoribosyltransferase